MKEKNPNSRKNAKIILGLVILAVILCSYQFGYVKLMDMKNNVNKENNTLQSRLNELTLMSMSKDDYINDTNKMKEQINSILSKYGPMVLEENHIMRLRDIELQTGSEFPSASFSSETTIYEKIDEEDVNSTLFILDTLVSTSYKSTYQGLKNMLDYITNCENRMNVESITVSFDRETGNLAGNMLLNVYSNISLDKPYEQPVVGGVEIGMDNIFQTTEIPLEKAPNTK